MYLEYIKSAIQFALKRKWKAMLICATEKNSKKTWTYNSFTKSHLPEKHGQSYTLALCSPFHFLSVPRSFCLSTAQLSLQMRPVSHTITHSSVPNKHTHTHTHAPADMDACRHRCLSVWRSGGWRVCVCQFCLTPVSLSWYCGLHTGE